MCAVLCAFQMANFNSSYPCSSAQSGSNDYILEFSRNPVGAVVSVMIQGAGLDINEPWLKLPQ